MNYWKKYCSIWDDGNQNIIHINSCEISLTNAIHHYTLLNQVPDFHLFQKDINMIHKNIASIYKCYYFFSTLSQIYPTDPQVHPGKYIWICSRSLEKGRQKKSPRMVVSWWLTMVQSKNITLNKSKYIGDNFTVSSILVGGFNPSEKYESNWNFSPRFGVKKKIFETTTYSFI